MISRKGKDYFIKQCKGFNILNTHFIYVVYIIIYTCIYLAFDRLVLLPLPTTLHQHCKTWIKITSASVHKFVNKLNVSLLEQLCH